MIDLRRLVSQLHELAWSAVQRPAADPWTGSEGTREERRAGSLQLLALYSRLIKVLQRRIDLTIKDALDAGSDYGEIASACGVSRQAIRQRWLRRTTDPRWFEQLRPPPQPGGPPGSTSHDWERPRDASVRLVRGPLDGARDIAFPGQVLKYEADRPPMESSSAVPLLAWYIPSKDDANVYLFGGVERDTRRMYTGQLLPPGARGKKPRVYELAAELGVESRVIMLKLQEMGEFVRSASSTVEHLIAHRLRMEFAAQTQHELRPPG